ncbi:MAG: 2,3-cyclic 3-phosphodiesterase [Rhodospirillaceae bacterium]|jgi:2'-5' RNA ligase|nr:2,3-cyclic 3-phosphodiesterase [Rhodospirillaceae bacterium]
MRLFVAVALPENVRWQLRLLCGGLPGARWVAPENFHITLRFIGEVDGAEFHDIDAALAGLRAPGFSLSLAGVGHFGSGSKLRSVWAGIDKQPALNHLRDKVESAVVRAGIPPNGQKYQPHVTLARSKGEPVPKLGDYLVQNNLFRSPPFEVTHFTLFSSFLNHNGAIYRPERIYELTRA